MLYVAAVALTVCLTFLSQWRRHQQGMSFTTSRLNRDAASAFGVGALIAFAVASAVSISVRFVLNGGTIKTDLFDGFDGNELMVCLGLGAYFSTSSALREYIHRLNHLQEDEEQRDEDRTRRQTLVSPPTVDTPHPSATMPPDTPVPVAEPTVVRTTWRPKNRSGT